MLILLAIPFMPNSPARADELSYNWDVIEISDGIDPSLAIDNSGNPHMCFGIDEGDTNQPTHITYARKENNVWYVKQIARHSYSCAETSILIDNSNKIHIVYATEWGRGVWYFTNKEGYWQVETVKYAWTGNYESLCTDDNEKLHVCYWNNNNWDSWDAYKLQLNYKCKDISAIWRSQPVEGLGAPDIKIYAGAPYYKAPVAMAATHGINPIPHVIAGIHSGKLKHYWKNPTTWSSEPFAEGYELSFDANDTAKFDSNNTLYCILIQAVNYYTKYFILAKRFGGQWSYENITQLLRPCDHPRASLAIDSQDKLHIAFFSGKYLYYGVRDGATWNFQEICSIPSGTDPGDVSIKLDNSDLPRIVYSTMSPKKVYYAETYTGSGNRPLVLFYKEPETVNEGELLSFNITARDPNGDPLTYFLEAIDGKNYPVGSSFGSTTGLFQWIPTYEQADYYESRVRVSDGNGGETSQDMQITVYDTPIVEVSNGQSIQDIIDDPEREISLIRISPGIYEGDITIEDGIALVGDAPYNSIIKGNIAVKQANLTIENLTISYGEGGMISFNNTHYSNLELMADAGVTAINSNINLRNCIIKPDSEFLDTLPGSDNSLKHYGKGIQIWNMYRNPFIQPQIEYNLIHNTDCAVYYFSQAFGGAMLGQLKNNTFYNNNYGLILRMHKEKPEIKNNIITNGETGIFFTYCDEAFFDKRTALIHHNDVWGNTYNYWLDEELTEFDLTGIDGNISQDPLFVDAQGGNFYLQEGSPCLFAADDGGYIGAYPVYITPPVPDKLHYYTSQTSIEITGTKEPNTSLWVNRIEVVPLDSEVNWSFTASDLVEGDNILMLTCRDVNLAESFPPVTVTVTLLPVLQIEITSHPNNACVSMTPVDISGTVSDNTATAVVNGIPAVVSAGMFTAYDVPLTEGANVITAEATNLGWETAQDSITLNLDFSPPTTPVVTDDGKCTTSLTQLHASWSAEDTQSGIVEYQYSIGIQPYNTDIVGWTSAGTQTEVTHMGLSLTHGQAYYISVKAKNGVGFWSEIGYSDGIKANQSIPTIIDIQPPDGSSGYAGDNIDFSVTAQDQDGDILLYQFSLYDKQIKDWQIIQSWQSSSDYSWSTAGVRAGMHTIKIEVSDDNGGEVSQDIRIYLFRRPPETPPH